MVVEIEYYKGDVLIYGNNVSGHVLKKQLIEIENYYDKLEDNFVNLLCRRFGWTVLNIDALPDFTYDRDTGLLFDRAKRQI
ncbi:MAG: hypothetical protein J6A59_04050 [Lachnospiraceae bacterium]|nr:hypothetical protein [Lachnospiraceae bacterium]